MEFYQEALNRFQSLFAKALQVDLQEPTACTLSTVGSDGQPSGRTVLLKGVDERGFVFYTNTQSRKGQQLKENPKASLCFFWAALGNQVHIEGSVNPVGEKEADDYWNTRPRESQLGAWASLQSKTMEKRENLLDRYASFENEYENKKVPRPPHWSGYRLVPHRIEFWTSKPHRLHERILYEKRQGEWDIRILYP